jgi:hypothetical protein
MASPITRSSETATKSEHSRIVYHVAAVDHQANSIAASMTAAGWVLPTAIFPPRTRQRTMLMEACAALPMAAMPRCRAFLNVDQTTDSVDYMLIVDVGSASATRSGVDQMIDCRRLQKLPGLVPYQQRALNRLLNAKASASLALQPYWLSRVANWAADASARTGGVPLIRADLYRATEFSAVVALVTPNEVLHFKANAADAFVEARVTQLIATLYPSVVVPTRAFDAQRGWWLTEHVDGVPLTGNHWPAHLKAVDVWIHLQQTLRGHEDALQSLGVMRLDRRTLEQTAEQAIAAVDDVDSHGAFARMARDQVQRLLSGSIADDAHEGLLHFDAAARNMLQTDRGLVFLDFESAWLGPSAICGELMSRKMRDGLTPAQHTELSRYAAAAALRRTGCHGVPSQAHVSAMTDLCLLASNRASLMGELQASIEHETSSYLWKRIAMDFLDRANTWQI